MVVAKPLSAFQFPNTKLKVSRLGYGAMQLAGPGVYGPPSNRNAAIQVLQSALELGVDHIDTSDFYGPHVTNQIIKEALHPYQKNLVIVTKVGNKRAEDKSWPVALSAEELKTAVQDNLVNLGLESLPIVNLRVGKPFGTTEESIAEPLQVLLDLKQKGWIQNIGISNASPVQVKEARAMTEIVCVQNFYNLAHRNDDDLIDELAKDGIAYVPFFPLGGFSLLQSTALSEVAKRLDKTPMQIALAWLLQRSPNLLLIPGTSSVIHLKENLDSSQIQFSEADLTQLNAIGTSTKQD